MTLRILRDKTMDGIKLMYIVVGFGQISGLAGYPAGYRILKLSGWISSVVGYSVLLY